MPEGRNDSTQFKGGSLTMKLTRLLLAGIFVMLIVGSATALRADEAKPSVIHVNGWSFARSEIKWYASVDEKAIADKKKRGVIDQMCGWAEYDLQIPATGWYELALSACPDGWNRDVYVDGERIITLGTAGKEDRYDRTWFKETNLHLTQGKHTIRFRRLGFPGVLPGAFELRPADGRPEGCASVKLVGQNVLRVGEKMVLEVTGGTTKPTAYELVEFGEVEPSEKVVTTVKFPAGRVQTQTISIPCTTEGVFSLRARVDGRWLRPNDFRVHSYAVIDTRRTKPAPDKLTKVLIHDIDCVKQTDMGKPVVKDKGFWEATEPTRVARSAAGEYREGGDGTNPNLPHPPKSPAYRKYNSGFSYAIDVPEEQELYMIEVDYPDDDRRTVNVVIAEPSQGPGRWMYCQLYSGYETGDWFELSNTMQTTRALFWSRGKTVRAAILSKNPGMRAAAARVRVYQVKGGLTEGGAPTDGGRLMVQWMEEPTRWLQHGVPSRKLSEVAQNFVAIDRYLSLCRYHGFNAVSPTEACYQGGTFLHRRARRLVPPVI